MLADPFIAENIDEVSRNMRTKAVLKLIAPYTRFSLQFISKHIKIAVPEVMEILSFLILDKKLDAKIDQENGTVTVASSSDTERLRALEEWNSSIRTLWQTTLNGEGLRPDDTSHGGGPGSMFQGFGDEASFRALSARTRKERKALGGKSAMA